MATIFLDTAPLIYLVEGSSHRSDPVKRQLEQWINSDAEFCTSAITLMELLVHPIALGDVPLQRKYRTLFAALLSRPVIAIDDAVGYQAACFRAQRKWGVADALQMACAVVCAADVFYTNDLRVKGEAGIEVVVVDRGRDEG